jgi:6-phosphogluconolactonase (cycloisomerase 2 family)/uncharacterized protein YjdB
MKSAVRRLAATLLIGLTGLIAACGGGGGGGGGGTTTPPPVTLTSISITGPATSLAAGMTAQYSAMGVMSDGTKQSSLSSLAWTSSAPTVATISAAGVATAVGAGTTTITATSGGVSSTTTLTVTTATLDSIGVTPAVPSLVQGTSQQFTATGVYSDHTKVDLTGRVTWASGSPTIATVNSAGLGTGVAAGDSTITATLGSVSGSTSLTVTAATLVSIAVTPSTPSVADGLTKQFTATGTYSNHRTQDLTSSVQWTSSTPAVAPSPSATGLATTSSPGTTTITATLGSISGSTVFTVTPAALVSIQVTAPTAGLAKGTGEQFVAVGTYTDNAVITITGDVTWSSSNPAIATVSNASGQEGYAASVAQGSVTISAASGSVTGSASLTINPAALVSIAITPANPTVIDGLNRQLTATGTYTDNSTQDVTAAATWLAGNSNATVSSATGSSGLATGLATGTSSITAAVGSIVSPAITLTVSPAEYAYATNYTDGTVSQYSVGQGGILIPMTPTTVAAGSDAYGITVDPTHHYAYVANFGGTSGISAYTIGSNGALTANGTFAAGSGPNGVTVDPTGQYVYVPNFNDGTVSQYTIQPDGTLASMTPATVTAGGGASQVTISTNAAGTFAYVPNFAASTVSVFKIGTGGALSLTSTATLAAGSNADSLVIDPTGTYAYVSALYSNNVQVFSISPVDGSLTASSTFSQLPVGGNPRGITEFTSGSTTYLYVPNSASNEIVEASIGAGGALTTVATLGTGASSGPNAIVFDPSGQYAYVTDRNENGPAATPATPVGNTISQYSIGTNGVIAPLSTPTVAAGNQPACMIVTPGP